MKDSAKPGFLKNQVAYYVTNRDKWEYAESLDKIGENKILLYLDANGDTIHDIRHPDLLAPRLTDNEIPAGYVYNPLDKRFSISTFGNNLPDYLTDQTGVNALLNKSIVYQSDPWEIETEVSGFFKLDVYIETDVRDLDLEAAIYEIKADSSCVLLTSNFVRARYRESLEKEKLLIAGDINLFHFEDFPFISRVIEKGSKLRLVITCPNSSFIQKNYCSGGAVAYETAKDARVAHVKIYTDRQHPGVLFVPVMF
jgi:hypothetical protein